MKIEQKLLTINPYSRPGTKRSKTTKIAIHYVGNPGSTAIANRNYFNNLANTGAAYASSHYIIGLEGEIIKCVPEEEIAYTTNSANAYSIGIECCHPNADGVFTATTRKALVELCEDLCKRYNLNPLTDLIRHYDVTGKSCPLAWASNTGIKYQDWCQFKEEVKKHMEEGEEMVTETTIVLNGQDKKVSVINKDGTNYIKLRDLQDCKINIGYAAGKPTVTVKG